LSQFRRKGGETFDDATTTENCEQAFDRGLITRQQLRNAKMSETARKIAVDALRLAAS
jgi:hypothetical protein